MTLTRAALLCILVTFVYIYERKVKLIPITKSAKYLSEAACIGKGKANTRKSYT